MIGHNHRAVGTMNMHPGEEVMGLLNRDGLAPYGALVLGGALGLSTPSSVDADILPSGVERRTAVVHDVPIELFIHQPAAVRSRGILLLLHGQRRNAAQYLEYARDFSDRHKLLAVAPGFDRERFANRAYQRGGITRNGRVEPNESWTVKLLSALLQWVRRQKGAEGLPAYVFGHSAGGQFLSRVAAFSELDGVRRIVIANPSSHVSADLNEPAPYGLGGVFDAATAEPALRRYLAQPVTIYLGDRDTGDYRLHGHPAARRQGPHRLARGRNVFNRAAEMARALEMPFNWRLVIAPGVGHSGRDMLNAKQMETVLGAFGQVTDPVQHPD